MNAKASLPVAEVVSRLETSVKQTASKTKDQIESLMDKKEEKKEELLNKIIEDDKAIQSVNALLRKCCF